MTPTHYILIGVGIGALAVVLVLALTTFAVVWLLLRNAPETIVYDPVGDEQGERLRMLMAGRN